MNLSGAWLDSDQRLHRENLAAFLPSRIFDLHAHLYYANHFVPANIPPMFKDCTSLGLADYNKVAAQDFPGRPVDGLFFGFPNRGNDRAAINEWIAGEVGRKPGGSSRALALVSPEDNPEAVTRQIQSLGLVGIKSYHLYAQRTDSMQASLEEFFPEWMWKICDDFDGILMIHLVGDAAIADPENQRALRRLCEKYPRCRVVLAHVARSFNYRHARRGLRSLVALDNVSVDTSAITETESIRCALETLGPRRVLFGSDYPVSLLRGRCVSVGESFLWLTPETAKLEAAIPAHGATLIGLESLLCLREACDDCGLRPADVERIFSENARELLAPHLLPKTSATSSSGHSGPDLWRTAKQKISGGTGLLSKRAELFDPQSWPSYFSRCLGSEAWDLEGRRYIDFAGGVGAILLGYADHDVTSAVKRRLNLGTYCNLVSPDEPELAELLLNLHPWAGRVRLARGGGEALTIAVRIARAATGRSGVAFCGYHGWQDWYLAANLSSDSALDGHLLPGLPPLGVPRELQGTAVPFRYNDLAAFEEAVGLLDGRLAAVVMEPMRSQFPQDGFLEQVAARCRALGAIFVVDEVTSGWRYGFPGALPGLGVEPDIVVYAKAMSNGFPCAAIVGRAAVMDAANPSFISSSYWTDGVGPAAALACINKMRTENVQAEVWQKGERLKAGLEELSARHVTSKFKTAGMPCAPSCLFELGGESGAAKAVLIRRMLAKGFLVSSVLYVMQAHTAEQIRSFLAAMDESLQEIDDLVSAGRLQAEAGITASHTFARLT